MCSRKISITSASSAASRSSSNPTGSPIAREIDGSSARGEAATSNSIRRTDPERTASRSVISSASRSGIGRASPGSGSTPRRTSARASSRVSRGLPPDASWSCSSTHCGNRTSSLDLRICRSTSRPSGSTAMWWIRSSSGPLSRPSGLDAGSLGTRRQHDAHGRALQATKRELEDAGRGRIEPLHVVHAHDEGTGARASASRLAKTPKATAFGSGEPSMSTRRSAASRAIRCGGGKATRASSSPSRSRSATAANASFASDSTGRAEITR